MEKLNSRCSLNKVCRCTLDSSLALYQITNVLSEETYNSSRRTELTCPCVCAREGGKWLLVFSRAVSAVLDSQYNLGQNWNCKELLCFIWISVVTKEVTETFRGKKKIRKNILNIQDSEEQRHILSRLQKKETLLEIIKNVWLKTGMSDNCLQQGRNKVLQWKLMSQHLLIGHVAIWKASFTGLRDQRCNPWCSWTVFSLWRHVIKMCMCKKGWFRFLAHTCKGRMAFFRTL